MEHNPKEALALVAMVNKMLEDTPGSAPIFDALRRGAIDPQQAVAQLAEIALQAGHGEALVKASSELTDMFNLKKVEGVGGGDQIGVMKHDNGMEMLNPLMEAAIMERSSLDGDVPEARVGPIPEGGWPAVPVKTDSMDPVFVGLQLKRASDEVADELKQLTAQHSDLCERMLAEAEKVAANVPEEHRETALEVAKRNLPPVPAGVKGYEAGQLPSLRKVEVNPMEVTTLTLEARRQYTFAALGTTQGRRSLVPVVEKGVIDRLRENGVNAQAGEPEAEHCVTHRWYAEVFGAEDLADDFNPITIAIASLTENVLPFVQSYGDVFVRVTPLHGIADRRFGWAVVAGRKP